MALFPEKYHRHIYYFALVLMVIGLPISKFLMSVSQIILAANWFLEGNVKGKFIAFFNNRPALIISSVVLLHFLGLLYTEDYVYALKDIRIKAPLLVLPVIISTSHSLNLKQFDNLLKLLVASVFVGTLISTFILLGVIERQIVDIRDISIFISHIRFSLLICVAIYTSVYFLKKSIAVYEKALWMFLVLWLTTFLVLLESVTGLMILLVVALILFFLAVIRSNNKVFKYVGLSSVSALFILSFVFFQSVWNRDNLPKKVNYSTLEMHTSSGNPYHHDTLRKNHENGNLIWIYYSPDEINREWNKRSEINITGKDRKGNDIYYTLVRFLSSKGLRKDSVAIASLTDEEVKAIERGVANINYQSLSSLSGRISQILWEVELYKNNGDANGHSLTQRFEYWKTAISIIRQNALLGVGTGDISTAFEQEYKKLNSSLQEEWRLRSHNQFLSIAVCFGLVGLVWFVFTLIYPFLKMENAHTLLYISFFVIACMSFLTEDTLETQAGATFFAFFNSFLLFTQKG